MCACVHACICKTNTKARRQRARFSQTREDDARGCADVAHMLAWLCACAHACTCKPDTEARVQRARCSQTRGRRQRVRRRCACVGMVVRVRARVRARGNADVAHVRMRWHACARARMRALTNPTPKERSNARAHEWRKRVGRGLQFRWQFTSNSGQFGPLFGNSGVRRSPKCENGGNSFPT